MRGEKTVFVLDPYRSENRVREHKGAGCGGSAVAADGRPGYGWNDVAAPDAAVIDAHIKRADFILVTHTHFDHILDVPYIALKTHATVIGTESTQNVLRAYNVPEEQLITVRGGEDFEFGSFS